MTFDPFRDFEARGYLRNLYGSKDVAAVKALEQKSFKKNLSRAIATLASTQFIEYKHILSIHQTLFGDIYPWAGEDRLATAPDLNITKGGYERMFAHPRDVRRAGEYALDRGQDLAFMRERPGEVMGLLAHAHPFLDGNGRTIMVLHAELACRARISIDWGQTDKTDYLVALTKELNDPEQGHLDLYLKPFIRDAVERKQSISALKSLKGLGETTIGEE
ncbi:Fic family protein [Chamaesiphon sp. OTE_8_metabat_110]|uniref:Fic/DOC family protein n=1 Tax=Chamaesiphon sp. OTE_8_metabat_110 TaxID=2964696 RepID=UPI00286B156A|nr:Fic family protein [Chamaesiphon sp. OTE_8_metabat_110]